MSSLRAQLAALEDSPPPSFDPEDEALDSLSIPTTRTEGREHYAETGATTRQKEARAQAVLGQLGEKYGGKKVERRKIFDDDDDDEEEDDEGPGEYQDEDEDEDGSEAGPSGTHDEDDEDEDENDGAEDEEDEEDEADEEEEEEDNDEDDDDDNGESDNDDQEDEANQQRPEASHRPSTSSRSLDPVAALRSARQKDIEKGRAIKRQKQFFDNLISLRITLQKALTASTTSPTSLHSAPSESDEIDEKRKYVLGSLSELSEDLFRLRERVRLPGAEMPSELGKRKRTQNTNDEAYWVQSGNEALAVSAVTNTHMLPILNKWSTKIQAATLQVNSRQAGNSRFLASTRSGPASVVEAIESGLSARREKAVPFYEAEETAYRALLREVIDSRSSGAGAGADLSHLRKEKKKKRELERGGSKGRKLRYTVHEKAQNFVVAQPLRSQWSEEQMDELFGSLLGGAGTRGARAEEGEVRGLLGREVGLGGDLGGLRVF